jgi:hypothetical protein
MNTALGYTTYANVTNMLHRDFPEVTANEQNLYLVAAEKYINNYCGYSGITTTSGMLSESIVREKHLGKVDSFMNMVIDLQHPPLHFDVNANPMVNLIEYNVGSVRVTLNLTDNSTATLNTVMEVSENRRKIVYPSLYFMPVIATVTPTAKINLFNLRDIRFWVDVSYIGGYDIIPEDITMAANYVVAEFLLHRDNPNYLVSMRQGEMSQTFIAKSGNTKGQKISENMHIANMLLQPYVLNSW